MLNMLQEMPVENIQQTNQEYEKCALIDPNAIVTSRSIMHSNAGFVNGQCHSVGGASVRRSTRRVLLHFTETNQSKLLQVN